VWNAATVRQSSDRHMRESRTIYPCAGMDYRQIEYIGIPPGDRARGDECDVQVIAVKPADHLDPSLHRIAPKSLRRSKLNEVGDSGRAVEEVPAMSTAMSTVGG